MFGDRKSHRFYWDRLARLLEGCTVYSLCEKNVNYRTPPTKMQKVNFFKKNLKVIKYAGPTSSDPVPLQQTMPYLPILTL
jgi:hypothetical protein